MEYRRGRITLYATGQAHKRNSSSLVATFLLIGGRSVPLWPQLREVLERYVAEHRARERRHGAREMGHGGEAMVRSTVPSVTLLTLGPSPP